jgi:CheY-like chemotaxis protein
VVIDGRHGLDRDLAHFFASTDLEVVKADDPKSVLAAIRDEQADAVVLTTDVGDTSVAALAEKILAEPQFDGRNLFLFIPADTSTEEAARWEHMASEFGLKSVDSLAQLASILAETSCIDVDDLPEHSRSMLNEWNGSFNGLAGKKVMIVDDDIRNIFALTSVLERQDIVTVSAETGRDAINLLQAAPDVDIVLMDIMMPEMDGIDTMRAIRSIDHFVKLPIIAVTAKAMKGDREKCIDAGAWDYLAKPVNSEQLLAVLRAWLTV